MKAYPVDRRICIFTVMTEYLSRTKEIRVDLNKAGVNGDQLFLSFCKPYKPVSKDTIGRWIKMVLDTAGIDVTLFKSHSLRHASTSKALKVGVPIEQILAKAGWSSDKMFSTYYNKPITNVQIFEDKLLKSADS